MFVMSLENMDANGRLRWVQDEAKQDDVKGIRNTSLIVMCVCVCVCVCVGG